MKPEKLQWAFWSEDLSMGFAAIDDDHKRILQLIARLQQAFSQQPDDRVVAEGIAVIADYSNHHFDREERMLAAAGYAHLDQHKARHESFRSYVAHAMAAQGESEGESEIDPGGLLSYLVDWWVGHIAAEDKLYRAALTGKEALIAQVFSLENMS